MTGWEDKLVRRGLALACFLVVWDVVEGVVAVAAGIAANSIAVIGFGVGSGIEGFAAAVLPRLPDTCVKNSDSTMMSSMFDQELAGCL